MKQIELTDKDIFLNCLWNYVVDQKVFDKKHKILRKRTYMETLRLFEDLNKIQQIDIFKDEKDYWCIDQIMEKDVLRFLKMTASQHIHYFSDINKIDKHISYVIDRGVYTSIYDYETI